MLSDSEQQAIEKTVVRLRAVRQLTRDLQDVLDRIYDDALALDDTLTDRLYER